MMMMGNSSTLWHYDRDDRPDIVADVVRRILTEVGKP
jgi:hypothetical protein